MSSSAFDFLLGDLASVPNNSNSLPIKKEPTVKDNFNALDWLVLDSDVPAPHPDAFELELDAIAALDSAELAALQSITTPVDTFNPADFGLFSQYRSGNTNTYSAYSGYGGAPSTITVSSETLSTYGSNYEPYDKLVDSTTAANSGPQQSSHLPSALSSLFTDIDRNFGTFNLSATASAVDSQSSAAMLPRLNIDSANAHPSSANNTGSSTGTASAHDNITRSHGGSSASAYDSASPSFDAADYLLGTTAAAVNSYLGAGASHPSLANLNLPTTAPASGNVVPKVENANVPLPQSESDPRKKYQCPACPRAFARAFNLKTHMATHDPNRVKSFVCRHSGCGRSFSRKHDLGRHLVSIHQDNSGVGPASSSTSPISGNKRASPIGVGSGEKQRIWCDSCGKGWLAGSRDACDCDKEEE